MFDLAPYSGRHPGVRAILKYFDYRHLPADLSSVSEVFWGAAVNVLAEVPMDTPELTVCLRKLLEAKDCAVRARMDSLDTAVRVAP